MLRTEDWRELDAEIAEARTVDQIKANQPRLEREKRRLERLRGALPRIALRQQTARELELELGVSLALGRVRRVLPRRVLGLETYFEGVGRGERVARRDRARAGRD